MGFNFNYGGMGGYGDMSWLKNGNQGNNQQPTTDDANAFNNELTNLWGGLDSLNMGNFNVGAFGSSSALGDMFQLGNSSGNIFDSLGGMTGGSGMMGSLGGMMGGSGMMGSLGGMMGGSGMMGSLGGMMGGSSTGNFDIGSMISGFMSMIMGFFSSIMGMFSGGNSSGGMDFGNMFGGLTGDSTVDGSTDNAEEIDPNNPEV